VARRRQNTVTGSRWGLDKFLNAREKQNPRRFRRGFAD
jgi:hypothetical protein